MRNVVSTHGLLICFVPPARELGVQKGTKVGVIEWDSHRYLEMYFGIPGVGGVPHTINPMLAPENLTTIGGVRCLWRLWQ